MHKNVCTVLSYVDHLLIVVSTTTGCVSISASASLVGISIAITSSVIALNMVQSLPELKSQ